MAAVAVAAAVAVLTPTAARSATGPKPGASCKRSQVGLAAANGLVCTKERTLYRWRPKPVSATAATPTATPVAAGAVPSPAVAASGGGAIGRTIWFSDQEIEVVSLTLAERNVVLDTRITNRGLRDERIAKVLNDMPVNVDTPSGSVRLGAPSLSSLAVGAATPARFQAVAPAGFSLAGATIRFGDSSANAVTVPLAGEPVGSQPALVDFVTGSGGLTLQTNPSRGSQVDLKVTRSLLRPQIRPGTKGLYDLQLELTITSNTASGAGANVEPANFGFDGMGTTCCTDLTAIIYTLPAGRTVTGWVNFSLSSKPGASASLTLVKEGTGAIPLTLRL